MQGKRIVIAHNWRNSGIERQNYELAQALSKENDVWFLSASRTGAKEIKFNDHLKVLEWPRKHPTSLKDLWFCWKLFRKIRPHIVMAHFTSVRLSMLGAWLAGVKNRLAWYHTLSPQLRGLKKNKWSERIVIMKFRAGYVLANYVVALHGIGRKDAMKFLHKPASGVFLIPNGFSLNANAVKGPGLNSSVPVFLFLGRLEVHKGGDFIIRCFSKIVPKYPCIKLQIVGGGDEEQSWKQLIETLQLDNIAEMPGRTSSYDQVFHYLENAYALLVPSRADNFPTVIIEAFSAGVPVIGSKTGGIPEMIEHGVNGFICETGDEEDWISKIEMLINDRGLRNKMAGEAKKTYIEKFTIETHINNVKGLLSSLVQV